MVKPGWNYLFIFISAYEKLDTLQTNTKLPGCSESGGMEVESTEDEKKQIESKTK